MALPGALSADTYFALSKSRCWQAATSTDPRLPQTLCMGAFHHTLVCAPGASPAGTAHKSTAPAGVAPKQPLEWYGARVRSGTCLAVTCAVPPCSSAGAVALSGRLGVSSPFVCTRPRSPGAPRMSRKLARRNEHLGVKRKSRGRGARQCGLIPPLAHLKRTRGTSPYDRPEERCACARKDKQTHKTSRQRKQARALSSLCSSLTFSLITQLFSLFRLRVRGHAPTPCLPFAWISAFALKPAPAVRPAVLLRLACISWKRPKPCQ